MSNLLESLDESAKWRLMVGAAKRGAEQAGYKLDRLPGRGLSNVWNMKKGGVTKVTSIRTTRDRWIAFPPLENGTKWKTLDDVELVLVAAVDDKENPQTVEVYLFDATEVRQRFDAAYAARIKAGQVVRDSFGMWVGLDVDQRNLPTSIGSGIVAEHKPIAGFSISSLIESGAVGDVGNLEPNTEADHSEAPGARPNSAEPPLTIADAKRRLAQTLGVDPASIKITVEA